MTLLQLKVLTGIITWLALKVHSKGVTINIFSGETRTKLNRLLPTCCYRACGKPSPFLSSNVSETVALPLQFSSIHPNLCTSMLVIDGNRTYF
ncbi:hypothetical protein V6N12_024073 [Hibiscus sabdariffa]|uniref:Secreted protein n=1 Tax=Hibiscus sabdariffa TaxID=183260 RepID=A0ABR2FZP4_9ROSI